MCARRSDSGPRRRYRRTASAPCETTSVGSTCVDGMPLAKAGDAACMALRASAAQLRRPAVVGLGAPGARTKRDSAGVVQIDLRLRRRVRLIDVGAGKVRRLRGQRRGRMAARAVLRQQRVHRGRERGRRWSGRSWSLPTVWSGGGDQLDLRGRRLADAPAQFWIHVVRMSRAGRRGSPASSCGRRPTFSTMVDCVGLRQIDDRVARPVGQVDIVGARELRRLAAGVVAAAAAIGGLDVLPQIDLECLHVGGGGRRAGIGRGRVGWRVADSAVVGAPPLHAASSAARPARARAAAEADCGSR